MTAELPVVQPRTQPLTWGDLLLFQVGCEEMGLPVPAPVVRGLELIDAAHDVQEPPRGGLLDLAEADVKDRVVEMSIRRHGNRDRLGPHGLNAGIEAFEDELLAEVRAATLPLLDDLVATLRPRFDEQARPLVEAVQKYGFTLNTTSDEVIDMTEKGATDAWRASREAFHNLEPIAEFRRQVSAIFGVSPTPAEFRLLGINDEPLDVTVCFAAAGNWSSDGSLYVQQEIGSYIDWFALAKGGIRLNAPDEVRLKILDRRRAKDL